MAGGYVSYIHKVNPWNSDRESRMLKEFELCEMSGLGKAAGGGGALEGALSGR